MIRLLAEPRSVVFNRDCFTDAVEYAQHLDDVSVVTTVRSLDDLCLTNKAERKSGEQYTCWSLRQVANRAAKGLYDLMLDMSGYKELETQQTSNVSPSLAAEIFNRCIEKRFDRFDCRRKCVVDTMSRTIDAVVGVDFGYFGNVHAMSMADHIFSGFGCRFESANFTGRTMSSLFLRGDSGDIRSGFYLVNSEAGEHSLSASFCLYVDDILLLYRPRCLRHVDRDFAEQLRDIIRQVQYDEHENYPAASVAVQACQQQIVDIEFRPFELLSRFKKSLGSSTTKTVLSQLQQSGRYRVSVWDIVSAAASIALPPSIHAAEAFSRSLYQAVVRG